MTSKEILLEQFEACYDDSAWFASAKSTLENLSAKEAFWKPNDEIHSVAEIINHLNFYNDKFLRRFKNEEVKKTETEIAETFLYEAEDWDKILNEFERIMSEWKNLLESADEARFSEKILPKNQDEWASPIAQMNIHNAYHIGQIILVRKLNGNWKSEQGVS
ncbi:MAG: DinB family protein [Pyrinomonadaceae bacterium]|jgi:uncharacterized damage-inducible protein DinB|nr:DinB family protein [Pyrinomonadaceae bacterium]